MNGFNIDRCVAVVRKKNYFCNRYLYIRCMKATYRLLLLGALIFVFTSCRVSQRYTIPVAEVEPVSVMRFDSLICEYVNTSDTMSREALMMQAGDFWGIYNFHLLGLSDAPCFYEGLSAFMSDSVVAGIYRDAQLMYIDMDSIEECLASMSARYMKLFPSAKKPVFQSHISVLGLPIVTVDSLISISIDCYLGTDYPLYQQRYNRYELMAHHPGRLLPDVGEVLLRNAIVDKNESTLLDAMVYEGVVAYLLSGLLNDNGAAAIMGYTPEQESWCVENEARIWSRIVEQGHLFAADNITIRKYIQPAPFTATLTEDAPGRVGRWVGWRIVQQYVEKQGLSPMDLVVDKTSSVEILRMSNYNPR